MSQKGYQFGTFKGVFTPSILTILGVIMYLRFGWVLGNVGLLKTLLIVVLSTAITLLTSLSLSALATNMKIGGGGAYYVISRSLGVEAGAAVGIPLFFAQALGISFYIAGFSESLVSVFPAFPPILVGLVTLVALTLVVSISADVALKTQYLILGLIGLSLVSFFLGGPPEAGALAAPSAASPGAVNSFWTVFAVFFPAVTGIEAGLALSGDLKDPAKSLPFGTLTAIGLSLIVYFAIPIYLSRIITDSSLLVAHPFIMKEIARWGNLIVLGVWGATLSSAMGALLGAPRTLQALSKDHILPRFIGRGYGKGKDPRIAVMISFTVALLGILSGGLNIIAPVLSMFFLTSYGLLNFSAAFEGLIASPSWRPTFKTPWGISLAGFFGCVFVMFMINPGATFMALLVSILVYLWVRGRQINAHWGDMRYGILMLALHYIIYKLEARRPTEKSWRPNILVLSGAPKSRWFLINIADALTHQRGLLTVNTVVAEDFENRDRLNNLKSAIRNYLGEHKIQALINIHPAPTQMQGIFDIVKSYGFGPIVPNTVLIGDTEKEENFPSYSRLIRLVHNQRRNVLIFRNGETLSHARKPRIEVLWGGRQNNIGLMLSLAVLVQLNEEWAGGELVLRTLVDDASKVDETRKRLESFIAAERIQATAAVIVKDKDNIFDCLYEHVSDSHLVFMGLQEPDVDNSDENYAQYYETLLHKTERFPPTLLTLASEDISFYQIFESD